MFVFAPRKNVARIGERGYPAAVGEPRVPTYVVSVHMRAHDEVDLLWHNTRCGEILQPRCLKSVERGVGTTLFVISHTGVDEDIVARGSR